MSAIVQFKAGRVDYPEGATRATPVRGQGTVKVVKSPDDPNLFSFIWEPRANNKSGEREELLLFPGDASWKHVPECTTGRVFSLSFRSSGQNLLFWMQTPVEEGADPKDLTKEDKQYAETINRLLDEDALMEEDSDRETVQTDPSASQHQDQGDFSASISQVMENLRNQAQGQGSSSGSGSGLEPSASQSVPVTAIADVLPQKKLVEIISSLPESQLEPLYAHIPDGLDKNRQELIRVIQSAQFAQSMDQFGGVLNNNGIGSLVASQLGNPYVGEGIEGFLNSARQQGKKDKEDKMDDS